LQFTSPLYYRYEKIEIGVISQLALEAGNWSFTAVQEKGNLYKITHDTGVSFIAELKNGGMAPHEFSDVLSSWLVRQENWQDSRSRFI
jgi:hypothetical protein